MDLLTIFLLTQNLNTHFLAIEILVYGTWLEMLVLSMANFRRFVTWVEVSRRIVLELVKISVADVSSLIIFTWWT